MAETRVYQRKKHSVPFTFTAEEYPPVASTTQALPQSETGVIIKQEHTGTIKNSSLDGFCFETDCSIDPGTELNAKMIAPTPIRLGSEAHSECRAKVRWCKKEGSETKNQYKIGAKRIRDIALPVINLKNKHFAQLKFF